MWRRLLNSTALAATTHKGFGKVSNGTSTQVADWMINKWRAIIMLYNVRDPPGTGDQKIYRENIVVTRTVISKSKRNIYSKISLLGFC